MTKKLCDYVSDAGGGVCVEETIDIHMSTFTILWDFKTVFYYTWGKKNPSPIPIELRL